MEKAIEIGGRRLVLRSSLYSLIDYRSRFGTELFDDIQRLDKAGEGNVTEVLEIVFRIVFVLSGPKEGETFRDFMGSLDLSLLSDPKLLEGISRTVVELLGTGRGKEESPKGDGFRQ